jgi:hypothetical protein
LERSSEENNSSKPSSLLGARRSGLFSILHLSCMSTTGVLSRSREEFLADAQGVMRVQSSSIVGRTIDHCMVPR